MIHIHTENKNGKWVCFGTIYGYDYLFEGLTVDAAQLQMREVLNKNNIHEAKWHEPKIIEPVVYKKYNGGIWNLRDKIDHL